MVAESCFLEEAADSWEKHPQFNASNTMLVEDTCYKSFKNDYLNCLPVRSFEPEVELENSSYLANVVEPWLAEWIRDPCPLAYCRAHPMFNVEDDLSPLVNYFVEMEGYSYRFDPPSE